MTQLPISDLEPLEIKRELQPKDILHTSEE